MDNPRVYHVIEFFFRNEEKYLALIEFQAQLWGDFPRMWENPSFYLFSDALWHSGRD